MEVFLFLTVLIGVPASIIILLIRYVLKKNHPESAAPTTKFLFILLFIGISGFSFWDWWMRSHWFSTELENDIEISVWATEYHTFLDWSVDLQINISNEEHEVDFLIESGEGPYFQFYTSEIHPEIIYVEGYKTCAWRDWKIDLSKESVQETQRSTTPYELLGFKLTTKITSDFEFEQP